MQTRFLYLGSGPVRLVHPQHIQTMEQYAPDKEWTYVDLYAKQPDFDTYTPTKHLNERIQTWDATKLTEVPDHSCHVIYSSHLLEHFPHTQTEQILKLWTSKLLTGGILLVNVPDLVWAAKQLVYFDKGYLLTGYYNQFEGEHGLLSVIYGSQSHQGEYHKSGYTKRYLEQLFANCGLKDITTEQTVDAHSMGVLIVKGANV